MLYLEDYVELIEHLPTDVRERLNEMRDMDMKIQTSVDSLNGRVKDLFGKCSSKKGKFIGSDQIFETIRSDYYKALEDADEKVQLANQIYDLVDRHLRKLDQELSKFKMELEADNAGITEILEQRSLELDNPVSLQRGSGRERKRTNTSQASTSAVSSSRTAYVNADGLQPEKCIKLEVPADSTPSNTQAQASSDKGNRTYVEKLDPPSSDGDVIVPSSEMGEEMEGGLAVSDVPFNLPSAGHEHISVVSHELPHRSVGQKSNYDVTRVDYGHRLNDADGISIDSLDTSGEHISDSTLGSMQVPPAQRPSRTKKQTSKAAAWVQERKLQAEARHEQKKKDNTAVGGSHDSADESSGVEVVGENPSAVDWNCDPNEPRYCLCNQISYGEMVGCDNDKCTIEWFHYGCVNLTEAPKGKWYCPQCTQTMKRRHKR